MKQQLPDYTNCLVNLVNSILEEFGIREGRQKLTMLEPYLQKGYKNIVVILLDGVGTRSMQRNLEEHGFFVCIQPEIIVLFFLRLLWRLLHRS